MISNSLRFWKVLVLFCFVISTISFVLLQAPSVLFKHTRFLAGNLGCSSLPGHKDWSQSLCQILFWWPFLFACQNYIFVTIYFSCFPKLLIDTFLKFFFLIFWSLLPSSYCCFWFLRASWNTFLLSFHPFCVVNLLTVLLPIFQS